MRVEREGSKTFLYGTQIDVPDRNRYVKTVSDGKILCPEQSLFCFQMTFYAFVQSLLEIPAFTRLFCVHKISVRSYLDFSVLPQTFCAFMFRHSCVSQEFWLVPGFCAFTFGILCVQVQQEFPAFTRLLCVHVQTFVLSQDFVCFCLGFHAF